MSLAVDEKIARFMGLRVAVRRGAGGLYLEVRSHGGYVEHGSVFEPGRRLEQLVPVAMAIVGKGGQIRVSFKLRTYYLRVSWAIDELNKRRYGRKK